MPNLYECECVECGHKWASTASENPPFSCPECESNDIEVVKKTLQEKVSNKDKK